jgi:hypothetical protein
MDNIERKVRQDYAIHVGTVFAAYDDFVRVKDEVGGLSGFKLGRSGVDLTPGTRVGVVALSGTDQAAFVVNRETGERHKIQIWHGNFGAGLTTLNNIAAVFSFVMLLIPFLGQLAAFAGGLGGIIGGLVASGVKGYPPVQVGRIVIALAIYFVGSVFFFSGWFGGHPGQASLGYAILVVGALAFTVWARWPASRYMAALDRLVDEAAAGRMR